MAVATISFPWETFAVSDSFSGGSVADADFTEDVNAESTSGLASFSFLGPVQQIIGGIPGTIVAGIPTVVVGGASGARVVSGRDFLAGSSPESVPHTLPEITSLEHGITQAKTQATTISTVLYSQGPKDIESIISNLESAMVKVLKVAVTVRGDYKTSWDDNAPIRTLIQDAKAAFDSVEQQAKQSLDRIAKAQSIVVDIQTSKLGTLKKEWSNLMEQTKAKLEGVNSSVTVASEAYNVAHRTQKEASESAAKFQQEMSRYETQRSITNVTRWLGPIGFLATQGAETILQSRENYERSMREYQKAQYTVGITTENLQKAMQRQRDLQSERANLALAQTQLPGLEVDLRAVQLQATTFQTAVIGLQDTAMALGRNVMSIIPPVTVTNELGYTKREIALGLMKTCEVALFHPRLKDECSLVSEELATGYGNNALPADVQAVLDGVRSRLKLMK